MNLHIDLRSSHDFCLRKNVAVVFWTVHTSFFSHIHSTNMGQAFVTGLFYGREQKGSTVDRYNYHIAVKQVYLAGLCAIMFLLGLAAIGISLVPGAGTGGPVVTFSSMPRIIWLIVVLATAGFTLVAPYFSSDGNIGLTVSWCMVFFWVNLVNVAAMVTLCISSVLELTEATSTLYLQNSGAWVWTFSIGSGVIALWSLWIMWRLWVYWHDVRDAASAEWHPGIAHVLMGEKKTKAADDLEKQANVPPESELNVNANIGSMYGQPAAGVFQTQKFSVGGGLAVQPVQLFSVGGKKNK
jgi:hypothetical protein